MKNIILTALLILSTYTFAALTADQKLIDIENQNWNNEFIDFLVNQNNPDLSMIGLSELVTKYIHPTDDENILDLTEFMLTFTDLITNEKLQPQSFMIAASICQNQNIEEFCPIDLVFKKLIESEPDNLSVYVPVFNQAVLEKDKKKIKQLLKQMSRSRFDDSYYYNSTEIEAAIDSYVVNSPNVIKFINNEIAQMKEMNIFSEAMIKNMENNPESYKQFLQKVGFKLKLPFPAYGSMVEICKTKKEFSQVCLKVIDIMINHSKTLISKLVGYGLKKEVLLLMESHPQVEKAIIDEKNFKQEYQCIVDIFQQGDNSLDKSFDLEYYNIGSKIERTQGEYAAYKKFAELNFKRLTEQGVDEVKNPKDCFPIQTHY